MTAHIHSGSAYRPPRPCAVCNRAARGIRFTKPYDRTEKTDHFCSLACSEIFMIASRRKLELTKDEKAAVEIGGEAAGRYLDKIGKTDLAEMTQEEWIEFLFRAYTTACDHLAATADKEVPF